MQDRTVQLIPRRASKQGRRQRGPRPSPYEPPCLIWFLLSHLSARSRWPSLLGPPVPWPRCSVSSPPKHSSPFGSFPAEKPRIFWHQVKGMQLWEAPAFTTLSVESAAVDVLPPAVDTGAVHLCVQIFASRSLWGLPGCCDNRCSWSQALCSQARGARAPPQGPQTQRPQGSRAGDSCAFHQHQPKRTATGFCSSGSGASLKEALCGNRPRRCLEEELPQDNAPAPG